MRNLVGLAVLSICVTSLGQQNAVQIKTVKVSGNVYVMYGMGGNMGLLTGEQGAFLVDDQFAQLTEKIVDAIAKVSPKPVRFLVNTHWHGDHTGGNENFGKRSAIIVAHENVRRRMSTEQFIAAFDMRTPPAPEVAKPVITFADSVTFFWNDEEVRVTHVKNAHTDGDAFIRFVKANVLHMGDCFFSNRYPFIDTSSGGTLDGLIAACDTALKMCDEKTKIIPGHGPVCGPDQLRKYKKMLETALTRVKAMLAEGKTVDEIAEARPMRDHDEDWGGRPRDDRGWIRFAAEELAKRPKK